MDQQDERASFGAFAATVAASRTRRRFDEADPVAAEQLRALVGVARLAPTANNTQLLRFRVVSGPDACQTVFSHVHWAALLRDWDGPVAGERPTGHIVVLAPAGSVNSPVRCYDAGIAAQTIMLAACTMGLGGCIIRNFDAGLLADLGLAGSGLAVSLVLALGRPVEQVVVEPDTTEHGVHYWREADGTHHVPKRSLEELLV